jgi:hypothetical protein
MMDGSGQLCISPPGTVIRKGLWYMLVPTEEEIREEGNVRGPASAKPQPKRAISKTLIRRGTPKRKLQNKRYRPSKALREPG